MSYNPLNRIRVLECVLVNKEDIHSRMPTNKYMCLWELLFCNLIILFDSESSLEAKATG